MCFIKLSVYTTSFQGRSKVYSNGYKSFELTLTPQYDSLKCCMVSWQANKNFPFLKFTAMQIGKKPTSRARGTAQYIRGHLTNGMLPSGTSAILCVIFHIYLKNSVYIYMPLLRKLIGNMVQKYFSARNIFFPQEIFFSARNIFFSARNIFFPQEINFSPQEINFSPQEIYFFPHEIFFSARNIFFRKKYFSPQEIYFSPQEIYFFRKK